ncbi:DEAD/DEAH box helicase [Bradyrhizobium neotropicale]|uniref:DEAD/DEAH box helicase n=1 Tax=Bradyrhizobium neotropicale TaxID=1497615 RepID=UPI0028A0405D|nr:DEAD/DEAH box helicase [Bradyrhizobium neotropicale]
MIVFDYRPSDRRAIVSWEVGDGATAWLGIARDILLSGSEEARGEGALAISLPWWSFLALRPAILDLIRGFGLRSGSEFLIAERASQLLKKANGSAAAYERAREAIHLEPEQLRARLQAAGFMRKLTSQQIRNICALATLPAGATFSVPGAGKTTEALAVFACRAEPGDDLLVVAPKNAFAAWDEQLESCLPSLVTKFVRLRKSDSIPGQLRDDPKLMIIGYHQLARVRELIAEHLARRRVHVFLDESHRIKGANNVTTDAVLGFSHLPIGKLIMSGTPMPQSSADLLPQFRFLFPEIQATEDDIIDLIKPVYVRTKKSELGLPPVTRLRKALPMDPVQARLYELMKSELARDAAEALAQRTRQALRGLGRSVTRVLQFVSNPALLARDIAFAHSDALAAALSEGRGPKLRYVIKRARELARQGKKVLIWSTFVDNVEYLAGSLQDLGAVYIHGGVDAGDENDDETREGKIRLFHDDPSVMALVANPAAAGEGISLHTICHHAIYLDRNFNAAQYLQSEDRIHRIGLPPNQETVIEIVECAGSVDETVRQRLDFKVAQMAAVLNDSSLRISPVLMDPDERDDDYLAGGLDEGDVQALLASLGGTL